MNYVMFTKMTAEGLRAWQTFGARKFGLAPESLIFLVLAAKTKKNITNEQTVLV